MTRCCADSCNTAVPLGNGRTEDGPSGDPIFYPHVIAARQGASVYETACGDSTHPTGICNCAEGFSYEECGSLGAAVGVQLSGQEYCHVVDCGHVGLTSVPAFPSTTTKLNLQNNLDLTTIPEGVFDALTDTENLYASSVGITALPPNLFSAMSSLKALEISITRITVLEAGAFYGLTALEELSMFDNKHWQTMKVGALDGLPALTTLALRSNKELVLTPFDYLPALTTITLANCEAVTEIPQQVFKRLPSVETVVFEHNANLRSIVAGSFGNTSTTLHTLQISGSPALTAVAPGGFAGLAGLKTLSLLVCGITALDDGVFNGQ